MSLRKGLYKKCEAIPPLSQPLTILGQTHKWPVIPKENCNHLGEIASAAILFESVIERKLLPALTLPEYLAMTVTQNSLLRRTLAFARHLILTVIARQSGGWI